VIKKDHIRITENELMLSKNIFTIYSIFPHTLGVSIKCKKFSLISVKHIFESFLLIEYNQIYKSIIYNQVEESEWKEQGDKTDFDLN
jgi:hypothetical protein